VADLESRAFRRRLTTVLVVLCLLTAGSVLLFGHLLFRTLSRSVYENALLDSRRDAEQLAKGLNERTSGNLYTLRFKQTEIENFVGSLVEGRQILTEVAVLDKDKKVIYTYKGAVTQNERPEVPDPRVAACRGLDSAQRAVLGRRGRDHRPLQPRGSHRELRRAARGPLAQGALRPRREAPQGALRAHVRGRRRVAPRYRGGVLGGTSPGEEEPRHRGGPRRAGAPSGGAPGSRTRSAIP
jgi:hypothetical protein